MCTNILISIPLFPVDIVSLLFPHISLLCVLIPLIKVNNSSSSNSDDDDGSYCWSSSSHYTT